jgi:DNA polymerase III psi subunit
MRRFERATRACQKRHAEWKDVERRRVRLRELAGAAVAAAALDDLPAARKQFAAIRREWHDLGAGMINDAAVIEQYTTAQTQFAARDAAAHEQDQKTRREALTRAQQLVGRIEAVAGRADLTLKSGERALKELRSALSTVPQLPSKKDYDEIVKRLKGAQTALMPKVQELRDVAGWQRWANVGIQEQLCEKMEALKAVEDPEAIAKQVRTLQEQWRQAADVPRAQGEALWKRFKAAHDEAWTRCEAHFAAQSEARGANLAKKIALCERAEALADSTSWIQTADEIKKLQAEWKTIGAVSRGQEKSIWERFRSACDRFFTRRHADLAERKTVWSDNLAKKEALCARADALKDSSEWDAAAAEMKRLQAEWKTVGPVKKSRSEALWQRFRGAADHFFARYAQRHDIALGERVAAREAICQELENLAAPGTSPDSTTESATDSTTESTVDSTTESTIDSTTESTIESATRNPQSAMEPPADLMATVRALRGRWQAEIAARGVDRDRALALDDRFAKAFAAVIARWPAVFGNTDLDPDANRKKMETIVVRIETLAKSLGGPASAGADAALSPTARMAAMLKEALAANTIGGKTDDDSRFRAAADDVRQAQASLSRIGPVPDQVRRSLADRFQRATRRIADVTQKATSRS